MIARQCSSCGGFCGGGYTVNGKYKFCKAENPKKKMTSQEAKQKFDNFGKTFTLEEARVDVHNLIDEIFSELK